MSDLDHFLQQVYTEYETRKREWQSAYPPVVPNDKPVYEKLPWDKGSRRVYPASIQPQEDTIPSLSAFTRAVENLLRSGAGFRVLISYAAPYMNDAAYRAVLYQVLSEVTGG